MLSSTLDIFTDQQLPSWTFAWLDTDGRLIDTSAYVSWRCEFVDQSNVARLSKLTGVGGADGTGLSNVVVAWGPGEWTSVPPATYRLRISAVDNVSGKRRYMPDEPPILVR